MRKSKGIAKAEFCLVSGEGRMEVIFLAHFPSLKMIVLGKKYPNFFPIGDQPLGLFMHMFPCADQVGEHPNSPNIVPNLDPTAA